MAISYMFYTLPGTITGLIVGLNSIRRLHSYFSATESEDLAKKG
jgi:hypothetical protein